MKHILIIRGTLRYYAKQAFLAFIEHKFGVSYSESIQQGLSKRIAFYESNK